MKPTRFGNLALKLYLLKAWNKRLNYHYIGIDFACLLKYEDQNFFHSGIIHLLAVGGEDGQIGLYDTTQAIWTSMATQLPASIASLAFSSDGTMLASGNNDKSLQLWDVAASQPIAQSMFGAPEVITSLLFDPVTGNLYTGSRNGALQEWLASPGGWAAQNCELAGRNFNPTEWEQFFPGQEYRETCPGY